MRSTLISSVCMTCLVLVMLVNAAPVEPGDAREGISFQAKTHYFSFSLYDRQFRIGAAAFLFYIGYKYWQYLKGRVSAILAHFGITRFMSTRWRWFKTLLDSDTADTVEESRDEGATSGDT